MQIKRMIIFLFFILTPAIINATQYPRETPIVQAVREVGPSVVNISSNYQVQRPSNPFSGFGINPFFDNFFKDFINPGIERMQKRSNLGSGVIIDGKRGFILTNAHVLAQADSITVTLRDKREFNAQVVGADPDSDLAILQISSDKPLPDVEMGTSNNLMIGETVIAIGNPFGFSHTVTTGVVSATDRTVRTEQRVYHNFIQIDASINPGNSGGPLLNINGELIGINTAIYSKAQGIGFAIPIDNAKKIVSDLIQYGQVVSAWIGITVQNIDQRLAWYLNVPEKQGVMVKEIEPKSPAHKSDIQNQDIILSIGKNSISSIQDYETAMRSFSDGDIIKIKILRNQKQKTVSIRAATFPEELAVSIGYRLFGIKVQDYNKSQGVLISYIHPNSYLARIGVVSGDIIRQMNQMTINNTKDFNRAIIKYRHKRSVVVLLQRGGTGYYITVNLS